MNIRTGRLLGRPVSFRACDSARYTTYVQDNASGRYSRKTRHDTFVSARSVIGKFLFLSGFLPIALQSTKRDTQRNAPFSGSNNS